MIDRRERGAAVTVLALVLACAAISAQAATVHVNPVAGNDANAGTQAAPLKTIGKALTLAIDATNIIRLADGRYDVSSGETFGWSIPGDTTLVGRTRSRVIIDGTGASRPYVRAATNASPHLVGVTLKSLYLTVADARLELRDSAAENLQTFLHGPGSMKVTDVVVRGSSYFRAQHACTYTFDRVSVDGAGSTVDTFIKLEDRAALFAEELHIVDMVVPNAVIDVTVGTAELRNSSIVDSWGTRWEADESVGHPVTVRAARANSFVRLIQSAIVGSAGIAVLGGQQSTISIDGGQLTDNRIGVHSHGFSELNYQVDANRALLRNSLANWRLEGGDSYAQLRDASFEGGTFGVQSYDNGRFTVSDSTFSRVSRPLQFESIDAQHTPVIAGQNLTFLSGAANNSQFTAHCTGSLPVDLRVLNSTWRANTQGSDRSGRYSPQTFVGVKKGNNFWLKTGKCVLTVN